jgi:hypothetical protein
LGFTWWESNLPYKKKIGRIQPDVALKVEGSVRFLDGVKNCTDSVHKFSRAFLLCYEFVQFLTPSKNLTDPSTFSMMLAGKDWKDFQSCLISDLRNEFSKTQNYVLDFIKIQPYAIIRKMM